MRDPLQPRAGHAAMGSESCNVWTLGEKPKLLIRLWEPWRHSDQPDTCHVWRLAQMSKKSDNCKYGSSAGLAKSHATECTI